MEGRGQKVSWEVRQGREEGGRGLRLEDVNILEADLKNTVNSGLSAAERTGEMLGQHGLQAED